MHRIVTFQDTRLLDYGHIWELKNPKFSLPPDGHSDEGLEINHEAMPYFKLRQSGSGASLLTNFLTPSRLYGVRKLCAGVLWLFIMLLVFGTVYAYQTGTGEIGQILFTLFFVVLYLLFFIKAGSSRVRRWGKIYTKAIKADVGAYTEGEILFDGQDLLLANERIVGVMGERSIAEYVGGANELRKEKQQQELKAKKAIEKEKARLKKEKEDREFNEALAEVGPLIGGTIKNLVTEGGVSSRAAQAARGNVQSDSLSARAARAARGTTRPPETSNAAASSGRGGSGGSVKIEGFTGSYWEACASGLDNNANYIAQRMQQIRKSNPRYTKLRAVDSSGRVIDVG
ncbi:MAG: hypothetical protein ACPGVT_12365 [Maricaulaceae bacterium]